MPETDPEKRKREYGSEADKPTIRACIVKEIVAWMMRLSRPCMITVMQDYQYASSNDAKAMSILAEIQGSLDAET